MISKQFVDILYKEKYKLVNKLEKMEPINDFDSQASADLHNLRITYTKDSLDIVERIITNFFLTTGGR